METTCKAMGHNPMSRIYEAYYNRGLYDLNVTDRLVDGGDGTDTRAAEHRTSLAIHKAELVRQCWAREKALSKYVNGHKDVHAAEIQGNTAAIGLVKRKIKRHVLAAMIAAERDIQKRVPYSG